MTYSIRSSRRADRDIAVIFDWISKHSVAGGGQWLDAFESAVDHLRENADHCARALEADDLCLDLRQSLFRTRRGRQYRLLFVIRGDVVHLAAVLGPGQEVVSPDDLELPE